MSFAEWSNKKKKKEEELSASDYNSINSSSNGNDEKKYSSFSDWSNAKYGKPADKYDDIAPVKTEERNKWLDVDVDALQKEYDSLLDVWSQRQQKGTTNEDVSYLNTLTDKANKEIAQRQEKAKETVYVTPQELESGIKLGKYKEVEGDNWKGNYEDVEGRTVVVGKDPNKKEGTGLESKKFKTGVASGIITKGADGKWYHPQLGVVYDKGTNDEQPTEEQPTNKQTESAFQTSPVWSLSNEELQYQIQKKGDELHKAKAAQGLLDEENERTWFDAGAFEDGYDKGDVVKSILGTISNTVSNIYEGALKLPEQVVDTGAYLVGGAGKIFGNDVLADNMQEFIEKDIIDEKAIADVIVGVNGGYAADFVSDKVFGWGKVTDEENSMLGEKSQGVAQSVGQWATQVALTSVGVPWWLTSGVQGFGSGVEEAFGEGASFEQAGMSAGMKAGIEILGEKLFGGSGLGEKGLINLDALTKGISNKSVKALFDFSIDVGGEGTEEVFSAFFGRLADKLTYEKEDTWKTLLTDGDAMYDYAKDVAQDLFGEEAREEYGESFIGGAFIGGFANAGKTKNSIENGTDYRTGLTETDQKVFDKLYKDAVSAKEKESGGKLTSKEKAEIYDSVMEQMEKGGISVDTIEEVLGGDDYKAYKESFDRDTARQKEYDEWKKEYDVLYNTKGGDKSDAQIDRQKLLKQQIDSFSLDSNTNSLKDSLSKKVYESAKYGKLAESYREVARKGQAFQADLSQFKGKQREAIERAIKSGVLNNTNRSHELVRVLSMIEADKGIIFDYTNNAKLKESGFAVDGKTVNGFEKGGTVTLNVQSAKSWQSVVGHEITHVLEGTDAYKSLQKALYAYAEGKGELASRKANLTEIYKDIKDANIDAELTADLVGDYLFSDSDFIKHLTTDKNVFQKVYDEIKYLCKVATGKERVDIEKVKREFDKAWKYMSVKGADGKLNLSISGVNAKTADKSKLYDAMRRTALGEDAEIVRKDTGWYKGKDNKWRFYIPDNEMELVGSIGTNNSVKLGNYIEHHKLFAAYPDLKNVNVRFGNLNDTKNGKYSPENNEIVLNNKLKGDTEKIKDTLVHEIQHAIQNIEGFAVGGNRNTGYAYALNTAYDKVKNSPEFGQLKNKKEKFDYIVSVAENLFNASTEKELRYNAYRSLYGEVEARQVTQDRYFDEDLLRLATPYTSGNVINIDHETKKFIDIFTKIGYTKNEIEHLLKGVNDDKSGSIGNIESGSQGNEDFGMLQRGQLHHIIPTSGIDGADGGNQGASRDSRRGIHTNVPQLSNTKGLGRIVTTDNTNEIAPIEETSSADGVFFDAKNSFESATDTDVRFSLSEDSQGRKLSAEQQIYFKDAKTTDEQGNLKPFYHGTGRADRVGTVFRPDRATSGPMAFFTDNRQVADNYARDKADTSLEYDEMYDDYYTQFRIDINGENMSVSEAWKHLSPSQRMEIKEKAKHVTIDDDYENIIYDEDAQYGNGGLDAYTINAHKGNVLEALTESWLESGTIYGEEQMFLDVLKLVGLDNVQYMNPDFRAEKTYAVYLNITNPFDTSNISAEMVEAFKKAADDVEFVEGNSADMWDKRNIPPEKWIERLEYDIENGTTHCWTSIPDFVTDVLKEKGYDGIFDTGGKGGGTSHTVAIPFYSEQIKDVDNLNPTDNPDITLSLSNEGEDIAPVGTPLKDLYFDAPVREDIPTKAAPTVEAPIKEDAKNTVVAETTTPNPALYNKQDGKNGWYKDYRGLTEASPSRGALYDALKYVNPELLAEIYYETDMAIEHSIANQPLDDLVSFMEDKVRGDEYTPMQAAEMLSDWYESHGLKEKYEEWLTKHNIPRQREMVATPTQDVAEEVEAPMPNANAPITDAPMPIDAKTPTKITDNFDGTQSISEYIKSHPQYADFNGTTVEEFKAYKEWIDTIAEDSRNLNGDTAYLPNDIAPMPTKATTTTAKIADGTRGDELLYESLDNYPMKTTEQKVAEKIRAVEGQIADNKAIRNEAIANYDTQIANLQKQYANKKNKNTKAANNLLASISRLERLKASFDADYSKRISDLEARAEKMKDPKYSVAMQKQAKMQEHAKWAEDLLGDTSTWVDKKLGLQYSTNTERRNLRDIVRDANGSVDIARADAIDDALNGQYNREEAAKKRELAQVRKKYADLKITNAETAYIQMLGELRYNPDTTLTQEAVNEYYEKHKDKIDTAKVDKVIELARQDYDNFIKRVNEKLREQGMKEIPYRQGYFLHYTDPKQNFVQKLLNWKTQDNEIPTSIAGLTENFKPVKSWQAFDKQRHSDKTDYNFLKGFDTYSQGVLDWIYHLDTLQKRRAVENHIRFTHSDEGIKKRIKEVYANEELDANEAQAQIEHILAEAKNPLNNFVQDFTTKTNILAGKKNSFDRGWEQGLNRHIYSVMTNVQNRVSANMVLANVRSAMTNIIPITQSWTQVSPLRSLQATKDVIANAIKDDGLVEKSTFLTNRLKEPDNLYQTNWDKVLDKAGIMFEVVDNFSSQVIWRSKYSQNIANGMSESEAIKNADQFAENVMAGRSKGNEPTLFNAKNPLTKAFTMFQLEVNNQYGYLFKDAPNDLKAETKHWKLNLAKGYTTAFIGAYVYNEILSSLTGSDAALDPIGIIEELLRDLGLFDEEEEKEPTDAWLNFAENIVEEVPLIGNLAGGGRIPISSAIPYGDNGLMEGIGDFAEDLENFTDGGWENILNELKNPFYNVVLPFGGGQLKKTTEGLNMFSDEHPVSGSYTDSGNLRFPVEDTLGNRIQAGLFGQYANKNAREYFDNDYAPLKEKQIKEYIDVNMPISDYWKYRKGLSGLKTNAEKADYIDGLNISNRQKNILMNNILDRKEDVDMSNYDEFEDFEEFDYATKNPEKYAFSKSVGGYSAYKTYSSALNDIKADKDANGKTIKDSRKEKVIEYINGLDADYETKIILYKSEYTADDTYNNEIIEYLNNREDLTYEERVTIFTELGFTVKDGYVYWD